MKPQSHQLVPFTQCSHLMRPSPHSIVSPQALGLTLSFLTAMALVHKRDTNFLPGVIFYTLVTDFIAFTAGFSVLELDHYWRWKSTCPNVKFTTLEDLATTYLLYFPSSTIQNPDRLCQESHFLSQLPVRAVPASWNVLTCQSCLLELCSSLRAESDGSPSVNSSALSHPNSPLPVELIALLLCSFTPLFIPLPQH